MGLGYEHKANNMSSIVKRSHKQTVNRAAHNQMVGKCCPQYHFIVEQDYVVCSVSRVLSKQMIDLVCGWAGNC